MKDYTVLEALKRTAASKIENAFERGYEQGFNDCHSEQTEEEAKAHYDEGYKDGYNKGINEVMTIDIFEGIKLAEYNKGYGAGYKEAYQKGLKHGQELRVKETECAEACGMKSAWNVARKILSRHGEGYNATDKEVFGTDDVFSLSAFEAVSKLEAWEKKQDAPDGNIEVGDEVRMIGSDPKLDNCDYGVCTMVKPKTIYVMRMDGSVGEEDKEEWKKTGNHYNIRHILDQMKEHEVGE